MDHFHGRAPAFGARLFHRLTVPASRGEVPQPCLESLTKKPQGLTLRNFTSFFPQGTEARCFPPDSILSNACRHAGVSL